MLVSKRVLPSAASILFLPRVAGCKNPTRPVRSPSVQSLLATASLGSSVGVVVEGQLQTGREPAPAVPASDKLVAGMDVLLLATVPGSGTAILIAASDHSGSFRIPIVRAVLASSTARADRPALSGVACPRLQRTRAGGALELVMTSVVLSRPPAEPWRQLTQRSLRR